ncbi:hypothetical protein I546_0410 [Mycobacterium kansasii 732]|nr:hypothetical protein I546_0410 [Mycobacterium kansasii 732]
MQQHTLEASEQKAVGIDVSPRARLAGHLLPTVHAQTVGLEQELLQSLIHSPELVAGFVAVGSG